MGENSKHAVDYTAYQHEQAFTIYYETRNYSEVCKAIGCNYITAFNWGSTDYACPHGCPWHGWERIVAEKDLALRAKLSLEKEGIFDAEEQKRVCEERGLIPATVVQQITGNVSGLLTKLVRSDFERISHLEYLWTEAFQQLTGLTLDSREILGVKDLKMQLAEFATGKRNLNVEKIASFEKGVKVLAQLSEMITNLKVAAGVAEKNGQIIPQEKKDEEGDRPLTLEEMRTFRAHLENTSKEQLTVLKSTLVADQQALEEVAARGQ